MAQRVGRGIALHLHELGTRRGWVVSTTPRPHFTPSKDPVHILQEAGWAPGPVWMGGKSRPHRDSIPDRPARSQSLYRLSYPAYVCVCVCVCMYIYIYYRLRWSRGSVLAFSTQVRGFKPGRSRRIFRANRSSARLPSEGK